MGLFGLFSNKKKETLDKGLEKTKESVFGKLARAVAGKSTVDDDVLDDLEEVLITSDVGVETTVKIIRRIEERVARDKYVSTNELNRILREEIAILLSENHSDDVLHLWQHLSHLRTRSRLELSNDFHLYIFRNMIMDGSLSRLHRTLEERIRITRKEKNHLHLHTIDARRICQHLALYEVLLGAWINHRSKRLFNQFWI